MRIPINLLSTRLRKEWVRVPAHPYSRDYGTASVLLQEVSGDLFDDLWGAVQAAEQEVETLSQATPKDTAKLHAAKASLREAYAAVIDACVVDHDPADFTVEVPKESPVSALGQEIFGMLKAMGFDDNEAHAGLAKGLVAKPFVAGSMAPFYARCQPDKRFLVTLLRFIRRFQSCDTPTPEAYWLANGLPPLAEKKEPPT